MLAQDKEVNVTSNRLVYTAAGATYTGDAKLWQDKTTVKGATILIDEKTGNLTASGGATTVFMFDEDGHEDRCTPAGAVHRQG